MYQYIVNRKPSSLIDKMVSMVSFDMLTNKIEFGFCLQISFRAHTFYFKISKKRRSKSREVIIIDLSEKKKRIKLSTTTRTQVLPNFGANRSLLSSLYVANYLIS